jgi:CubicO group peptidase (beta-lactamase class C family)
MGSDHSEPYRPISLQIAAVGCLLLISSWCSAHFGDAPHHVEPAEILTWNDQQRLQGFRSYSEIFPTRPISSRGPAYPLNEAARDFTGVSYSLAGTRYSVDDFVKNTRVAGMIMVHQGDVLYERYELGSSPSTLWVSYSIAKSVVSLLYGAAIADGYIRDVNDPVTAYLPRLAGGAYDGVTIKQLLQMSSGVAWREDYVDPEADVSKSPSEILALIDYMQALPRAAVPGTVFNYSTGETNLAGAVLRAAIGNNLATYLTHKIWRPFGMQADGNWMLGAPGGVEYGGCCISATLRDYARIGLFAMGGGRAADGRRILPADWISESTAASANNPGYGYFWWLRPDGAYAAVGIYGQMIWIDPHSETVIAIHSAWPEASSKTLSEHRWAAIEAMAAAIRPPPHTDH